MAVPTKIAAPDRQGGALRYRGVDIEELVGSVPFGQVWGLLVDGHLLAGKPPAEPHPLYVHCGDPESTCNPRCPCWLRSGVLGN